MNTLHTNPPLNGILFNPVRGMSGVTNFFHQGWPMHKFLHRLGLLDFTGLTFVAKTTTIDAREGNMPLKDNLMPREIYPRCIHVDYLSSRVLNAVGLSGPGFQNLLDRGEWQKMTEPFFLSFMPMEATIEGQIEEAQRFVRLLLDRRREFKALIGVQLNKSCPNTGIHQRSSTADLIRLLDVFRPLHDTGVAIELKIAVDMPIQIVIEIEDHPALDGICLSNTVPFGTFGLGLAWEKWYPHGSPLVRRGLDPKFKGGLSGEPLRELVLQYIRDLRWHHFDKPINGGGGLLCPRHVDEFKEAGATSIAIGSVAILRPWQVKRIIKRANNIFRPS